MTWRQLLLEELEKQGEGWASIVTCTLTTEQLDIDFDSHLGAVEGRPFTTWTLNRVYFPSKYDGEEKVVSVSRHPDGKPTPHIGGG